MEARVIVVRLLAWVEPSLFSKVSRRTIVPPPPQELLSGVKRPKRNVDYALSSATVKNMWSYTSAPHIHVLVCEHDIYIFSELIFLHLLLGPNY
jgi:hypothetical protein